MDPERRYVAREKNRWEERRVNIQNERGRKDNPRHMQCYPI